MLQSFLKQPFGEQILEQEADFRRRADHLSLGIVQYAMGRIPNAICFKNGGCRSMESTFKVASMSRPRHTLMWRPPRRWTPHGSEQSKITHHNANLLMASTQLMASIHIDGVNSIVLLLVLLVSKFGKHGFHLIGVGVFQ